MDETDVVILAGPKNNHVTDVLECLQSEGIAFLACGGRASGRADQPTLATPVYALGDAPTQEHCQGRDGSADGNSVVLDVAERM